MEEIGGPSLRVKLYKLNDEGTWDDYGTGQVSVEMYEANVGLVVTGETDKSNLLTHLIGAEVIYQRQGEDTIITWADTLAGTDVALSFQESAGCYRVWRQISEAQKNLKSSSRRESLSPGPGGPLSYHHSLIDEFERSPRGPSPYDDLAHLGHTTLQRAPIELPMPNLGNLVEISKLLTQSSLFQKEALANQMVNPEFISRLLATFKTAEDLGDDESLHAVYGVIVSMILINDSGLLEALFSDDYAMDVIGALEYNPEVPPGERLKHREFLKGPGALREVVPISDPTLRSKIDQAHRLGYVKDVVMPRTLDDATFATMSSLQLFNQMESLVALQSNPTFFPQLFKALHEAEPGTERWKDLVGFLQELIGLVRHLQATQRNILLSTLIDLGLFPVLASVLACGDDVQSRLKAADVLLTDVAHDPVPLRKYLQGEGKDFLRTLVSASLDSRSDGLQEQVLEILKVLLDPETMDASVEKDQFIDVFYDEHLARLLETLISASDQNNLVPADPSTLIMVIDLLCYFVTQHSYRIKYYILRNHVVEKVLRLLKRKEKAVSVAVLRFLRTCLSMRDEFYNRYFAKNGLLEPLLKAFLANGKRYNLFNSAFLELIEFVRKENMRSIVSALVESPHWAKLEESCDYVDTLKKLNVRYESNQDSKPDNQPGGGQPHRTSLNPPHTHQTTHFAEDENAAAAARAAAAAEARQRRGEKEQDTDEENYFREDDIEEEEPLNIQGGRVVLEGAFESNHRPRIGLVDYADDDEDDDTLPLGMLSRSAPAPLMIPSHVTRISTIGNTNGPNTSNVHHNTSDAVVSASTTNPKRNAYDRDDMNVNPTQKKFKM